MLNIFFISSHRRARPARGEHGKHVFLNCYGFASIQTQILVEHQKKSAASNIKMIVFILLPTLHYTRQEDSSRPENYNTIVSALFSLLYNRHRGKVKIILKKKKNEIETKIWSRGDEMSDEQILITRTLCTHTHRHNNKMP